MSGLQAFRIARRHYHDRVLLPPPASGKFAAMLDDIFGRTWPERELFEVYRYAVIAYRRFVRTNIEAMRADIAGLP